MNKPSNPRNLLPLVAVLAVAVVSIMLLVSRAVSSFV